MPVVQLPYMNAFPYEQKRGIALEAERNGCYGKGWLVNQRVLLPGEYSNSHTHSVVGQPVPVVAHSQHNSSS